MNSAADEGVTIVCLMNPRPEQAETLRVSLMALVPPTRAEPGCLAYDVYEEPNGSLLLVETWGTQQELAAHQQQPAVQALFGDRLGELLAENMAVHYGRALPATA